MIFQTGNRQHFMDLPAIWYFFEYLYEYTGKEPVTTLFILTGLGFYIRAAVSKFRQKGWKQNPFQLLAVYSVISIFVITWIVSVFKPMLSKHGTLAGLPFLMVMVFTGFLTLKEKKVNLIVGAVVLANLINLIFISKYYTKNQKDNFRQITELVIEDNKQNEDLLIISQLSKFYNYYFEQKGSSLRALNPNEIQPQMLRADPSEILVINAPFTEEKEQKLEPVNRLGFQILNPRLLNRIDSIDVYCRNWNYYILGNYKIESVYNDPKRNIAVGFKYKKMN